MNKTGEIIITLHLDEGRIVFEALAQMPFREVFTLIAKINDHTNRSAGEDNDCAYPFSRSELETVIRALGERPFGLVYGIVEKINRQLKAQFAGGEEKRPETAGTGN